MSNETTKRMVAAYNQQAAPTLFLSGLFQSPLENFHTSEEVEIDIVRSDEDISVVIQDLSAGYRMNSEDIYTNKSFKPPIHQEAIPLNSFDLIKRMPGQNPFQSPDFQANMILRLFNGMTKIERKIRRSIELQASQVLQTGVLTLKDNNGLDLYTLDYKPKATHFPTAGTAWNLAGADPVGDINALAEVVRDDGLADADQLIMGVDAWEAFIQNDDVQKRFDVRRIDMGMLGPRQVNGQGGQFRGVAEIGNYSYDVWTYGGRYKDPQSGAKIQFVEPGKVILRAASGRLDATFGAIPNLSSLENGGAGQLLEFLPGRLSNSDGGMDLFANAWLSENKQQVFGSVGARPLMIPTAIDTYGCLTAI